MLKLWKQDVHVKFEKENQQKPPITVSIVYFL